VLISSRSKLLSSKAMVVNGRNPGNQETTTHKGNFDNRKQSSVPSHHTNDRSYAVLLSKQRHHHASLWIGDEGGREP
jgi:hypothetical protein